MNTDLFALRLLRGETPLTIQEWLALSREGLSGPPLPGTHPLNLLLIQHANAAEARRALDEHDDDCDDDEAECMECLTELLETQRNWDDLLPPDKDAPLNDTVLLHLVRLRFLTRCIFHLALTAPDELPALCSTLRATLNEAGINGEFQHHLDYLEASSPEYPTGLLTAMLATDGGDSPSSWENSWLRGEASQKTSSDMHRLLKTLKKSSPQRRVLLTLIQGSHRLKAELHD